MKITLSASNPLEALALWSGLLPVPVVTTFWGTLGSRVVLAALRLGVFEALAAGPKHRDEVAAELGLDLAGAEVLLDALNGFGHLSRRKGTFALTRPARRFLTRDGKASMVDMMLFLGELGSYLQGLDVEGALRGGPQSNIHHAGLGERFWASYVAGLGSMARFAARELPRHVRLQDPKRLLDVGGAHGEWSMAMLRAHPGLHATILDLPGACAPGRQRAEQAGFADRLRYEAGDLRTAAWGEGYDVVLLFNVLHNLAEEECRDACHAAFAALRPGGTFVVLEGERPGTEGNLKTAEGVNELFFYLLSGSRVWPEPSIRAWMEAAGFRDLRRRRLLVLPMTCLLVARKG